MRELTSQTITVKVTLCVESEEEQSSRLQLAYPDVARGGAASTLTFQLIAQPPAKSRFRCLRSALVITR
jgi:hypothetical protein